jgi:hypothetical protein
MQKLRQDCFSFWFSPKGIFRLDIQAQKKRLVNQIHKPLVSTRNRSQHLNSSKVAVSLLTTLESVVVVFLQAEAIPQSGTTELNYFGSPTGAEGGTAAGAATGAC